MALLDTLKSKFSWHQLRESRLLAPVFLWFDNMPADQKNIAIFSAAGIGVLAVLLLLYSGYTKVSALKEEVGEKQTNLKELMRYEQQFEEQGMILKSLEREAKRKSGDFSLLSTLEALAQNSNIGRESIESISPKQLKPGDFFIETEATVQLVRVRLKHLIIYFHNIESSEHNLLLKEVRIKPRFDNPDTLNVIFKVSSFTPKE